MKYKFGTCWQENAPAIGGQREIPFVDIADHERYGLFFTDEINNLRFGYVEKICEEFDRLSRGEIAVFDFGFEVYLIVCRYDVCTVLNLYEGQKVEAVIPTNDVCSLLNDWRQFLTEHQNEKFRQTKIENAAVNYNLLTMSPVNSDSSLLASTDAAIRFLSGNNLVSGGGLYGVNFFNKNILIRIYEEHGYLHADYYDLINWRWGREIHNEATERAIPSLDERRTLISKFPATPDVLSGRSMRNFYFFLHAIENFMQDFLKGDFEKYKSFLKPMDANQRKEIEEIVLLRQTK